MNNNNEDQEFTAQEKAEILASSPRANSTLAEKFNTTRSSIASMRRYLQMERKQKNGAKIAAKSAVVKHAPKAVSMDTETMQQNGRPTIGILSKLGMMTVFTDEIRLITVDREGNISFK